jgi:hypothetical protein
MIPQQKIDQLAEAALRAEASDPSLPESTESTVSPASPPLCGLDLDLQAELEAREKRLKKKRALQSRSVTLIGIAALAGVGAWYHFSPSFQAQVQELVRNVRQSGKDVKTIGTITESYDKQLEKVAAHGNQLDQATRSLGGDPTRASTDDPNFDKQARELTGEDGSATDRTKQLKEKFGGVQKLGGKAKPADESSEP